MDRYPYQPCSTWPPFRAAPRSAPAPHSEMIACWQNGRRVLLHRDEVARLMKKAPSPREKTSGLDARVEPAHKSSSPEAPNDISTSWPDLIRPSSAARETPDARVKSAREEKSGKTYDLTPAPIRSRRRWLAQSEGWQMLAKRMIRVAGHPRHCHKPRCRRAKACQGGEDACYLREFETVDGVMQRYVLPAIAKKARESAQTEP